MAAERKLAVDGIVLLDKPRGRTSNQALQAVKRAFRARKAGHTGSLDPMASGLLPVCLGEATKISAYLLDADKRYRLTARFGERTSTGDAEGEVLETRDAGDLQPAAVAVAMGAFLGESLQVPPMYSALKHKGKPLYKLARQGIEIEREPRPITVHAFELLGHAGRDYEFELHCSKGTYVRTLVEDLGEQLGCGGHVAALRRTAVGAFSEPAYSMVTLEQLHAAREQGGAALAGYLLPLDTALESLPRVELSPDMVFYVRQGQAVQVPKAPASGYLRLYAAHGEFVGVGQVLDDGRVGPRRLLAAR